MLPRSSSWMSLPGSAMRTEAYVDLSNTDLVPVDLWILSIDVYEGVIHNVFIPHAVSFQGHNVPLSISRRGKVSAGVECCMLDWGSCFLCLWDGYISSFYDTQRWVSAFTSSSFNQTRPFSYEKNPTCNSSTPSSSPLPLPPGGPCRCKHVLLYSTFSSYYLPIQIPIPNHLSTTSNHHTNNLQVLHLQLSQSLPRHKRRPWLPHNRLLQRCRRLCTFISWH